MHYWFWQCGMPSEQSKHLQASFYGRVEIWTAASSLWRVSNHDVNEFFKIWPHSNGHEFEAYWTAVDRDLLKLEKSTLIPRLSMNFFFGFNDSVSRLHPSYTPTHPGDEGRYPFTAGLPLFLYFRQFKKNWWHGLLRWNAPRLYSTHVGKPEPMTLLKVLQYNELQMFMLRFRTLSAQHRHWQVLRENNWQYNTQSTDGSDWPSATQDGQGPSKTLRVSTHSWNRTHVSLLTLNCLDHQDINSCPSLEKNCVCKSSHFAISSQFLSFLTKYQVRQDTLEVLTANLS